MIDLTKMNNDWLDDYLCRNLPTNQIIKCLTCESYVCTIDLHNLKERDNLKEYVNHFVIPQ